MRFSHVRRSALWSMVLAAVVAGCGDDPTGPAMTASVTVTDFVFQPEAIQVGPGATVTWTWSGATEEHNVIFVQDGISDSGLQLTGTHVATMPTTPGTYEYYCGQHVGMEGTVQVVS